MLRVEHETARLGQRVEDIGEVLRSFAPLTVQVAKVEAAVVGLVGDVHDCTASVASVRASIEDRDKRSSEERKAVKVAIIGLISVILAGILSLFGALIGAGVL